MKLVLFSNRANYGLPHEVRTYNAQILMQKGVSQVVEEIKEFSPDLIIEEEFNDGVSNYSQVYKLLPNFTKAWHCVDAHITLAEHINYAKQFDYVFLAQSWYVDLFKWQVKGKCFYLPLCHTQSMDEYCEMLKTPVEKDIELSFVGNIRTLHVERQQHVFTLKDMLGDRFLACTANYENTLSILRRSKATFNCSLNNDLNFRVWEALACQTPILTDEVTDIFTLSQNSIKNTLEQLVTVYDKMYPDFSVLQDMNSVEGAVNFIKSGHTLTHRYLQLIEMVLTGEQYEY